MAPELFSLDSHYYPKRGDIWSMAICLGKKSPFEILPHSFSVAMLSGMLPWTIADQETDDDYKDFRGHNYTEDPSWQNMSISAMEMIVKMLTHSDSDRPKISWLADEVNGPKW